MTQVIRNMEENYFEIDCLSRTLNRTSTQSTNILPLMKDLSASYQFNIKAYRISYFISASRESFSREGLEKFRLLHNATSDSKLGSSMLSI